MNLFRRLSVPEFEAVRARTAGEPGPVERGTPAHQLLELVEAPFQAEQRYAEWIDSGVDILLAPTATATPIRLKPAGLGHRAAELNRSAVEAVRALAAPANLRVAAEMGPLCAAGPPGTSAFQPFDEAYIHYHEQAKGLALGGPDLVILRSIDDLRVLRAALVALRELWSGPAVVLLDPDRILSPGRTRLSPPPQAERGTPVGPIDPAEAQPAEAQDPFGQAAAALASLGVTGIGIEGTSDAGRLAALARSIRERGFELAAAALPDAKTAAETVRCLSAAGVDLVFLRGASGLQTLRDLQGSSWVRTSGAPQAKDGSTSPARSRRARHAAASPVPAPPSVVMPSPVVMAVEVDWRQRSGDAGAETNGALPREADYAGVRILAGTDALAAEGIRRRSLEERLYGVETGQERPLAAVVRDPLVLETALKAVRGRALTYLDSTDAALWPSVFYLANKYGAQLGIPLEPGDGGAAFSRTHLRRLLETAREFGFDPDGLFLDPLSLVVPPGGDRSRIGPMVEAAAAAKRESGARWIIGAHRFAAPGAEGTPAAPGLELELLKEAMLNGLDAVILRHDQARLLALSRGAQAAARA